MDSTWQAGSSPPSTSPKRLALSPTTTASKATDCQASMLRSLVRVRRHPVAAATGPFAGSSHGSAMPQTRAVSAESFVRDRREGAHNGGRHDRRNGDFPFDRDAKQRRPGRFSPDNNDSSSSSSSSSSTDGKWIHRDHRADRAGGKLAGEKFGRGMRPSGRPQISPVTMRNRGKEDRELFQALRQHEEAIARLGTRQGGPLVSLEVRSAIQSPRDGLRAVPGDYVEKFSKGNDGNNVGVILDDDVEGMAVSQNSSLIATSAGTVEAWRSTDIVLAMPNFVDPAAAREARPIILSDDAQDGSASSTGVVMQQLDVEEVFEKKRFQTRADICARVRVLQRNTEAELQRLSPHFGPLYLTPIATGKMQATEVTAAEVAHTLLRKMGVSEENLAKEASSPGTLLAAHRLLMSHPQYFIPDEMSHMMTNTFTIRASAEREAIQQVEAWIQNALLDDTGEQAASLVIAGFCNRAKEAMALREAATPSDNWSGFEPKVVGSSPFPPSRWTREDRMILTFVRASASIRRRVGKDIFKPLVMHIVKRCGLAPMPPLQPHERVASFSDDITADSLQHRMALDLLERLGFMTEWEDPSNLQLDRELFRDSEENDKPPKREMIRLDEHIRQEFTNTVYVIDDAFAHELDDGIAVESTTNPDQYWVHVHIADPTIAVHPGDEIARIAERRGSSIYRAHMSLSMLPPAFVAPLGLQDSNQGPSNTMRFSAKVNVKTGAATDIDIGLSVLTDVRKLTYDEATEHIRSAASGKEQKSQAIVDLGRLRDISHALAQRRFRVGGACLSNQLQLEPRVLPLPLPSSPMWALPERAAETPIFQGFPRIHTRQAHFDNSDVSFTDSRAIVSEYMLLAGRIAGKWTSDRGLPGLFRGQGRPTEDAVERMRSNCSADGVLNREELLSSQVNLPASTMQITPIEHFMLGINTRESLAAASSGLDGDLLSSGGYIRSTSPLRRFPDMLMQWQVKSSLRGENKPPYGADDLMAMIPRMLRMDAWSKSTQRTSTRYWTTVKLHRALLYRQKVASGAAQRTDEQDAEHAQAFEFLDRPLDALINIAELRIGDANLEERARVQIEDLDTPALCVWDSKGGVNRPEMGRRLRVRICSVQIAGIDTHILVEPIVA